MTKRLFILGRQYTQVLLRKCERCVATLGTQ